VTTNVDRSNSQTICIYIWIIFNYDFQFEYDLKKITIIFILFCELYVCIIYSLNVYEHIIFYIFYDEANH